MTERIRYVTLGVLVALEAALVAGVGYLVVLVIAARRHRGEVLVSDARNRRFVVIVPAHDEEPVIGRTLRILGALDYPLDLFEVVVIADNCSDETAEISRGRGATVLERQSERKGKGHALAWAIDRLLDERPDVEAFAIVDADCDASPNLLAAINGRFENGDSAVQANYVVANPGESTSSALRFAGFSLMNTVRPLGKSRLGMSVGLFGTGMAFTRACLESHPWQAFSLVEDADYHLQLVAAGERVEFVPEAAVYSAMPTSSSVASSQEERWESGRLEVIRSWSRRLFAQGLRERNPTMLHAALEHLVPPQSVLMAGNLIALAGTAILRSKRLLIVPVITTTAQVGVVFSALRIVRAPAVAYIALASAPALVARKLILFKRFARGDRLSQWNRTPREPLDE